MIIVLQLLKRKIGAGSSANGCLVGGWEEEKKRKFWQKSLQLEIEWKGAFLGNEKSAILIKN